MILFFVYYFFVFHILKCKGVFMCLNDLCVNEKCIISKLNSSGIMRRRLMDVGFIPGSIVSCVLSSPSGNPKGYLVKGSVIALRNSDASLIEVDLL